MKLHNLEKHIFTNLLWTVIKLQFGYNILSVFLLFTLIY